MQVDQSSGLLGSFLYWCHCFHKLRCSVPKCLHSMFSSQAPPILQIASFKTGSFCFYPASTLLLCCIPTLQTGYFNVTGPENDTDLLIFLTFVFLSQTGTLWILMETPRLVAAHLAVAQVLAVFPFWNWHLVGATSHWLLGWRSGLDWVRPFGPSPPPSQL